MFQPRVVQLPLFVLVQKCTLALALFVIVMFVGVLPKGSRSRRWLQPVRGELSIVAWILALGHMAAYGVSYASRILAGVVDGAVLIALAVACVLFVLLLLLGVTSFRSVKRSMDSCRWKRVQWFAYPFFAFTYIHLMLMLFEPALRGGSAARVSVAVYTVVFGVYAMLRVTRGIIERRQQGADACIAKC